MNKWIVLILGLAFVVILPLVDMTMNFSEKWTADTKFQITISLNILLITLLAAYIATILEKIDKREQEENVKNLSYQTTLNSLTQAVSGNSSLCFPIDKFELYSRLNELVLNSTDKLELMYLGEKPPPKLEKLAVRDKYIQELDKVINAQKLTIKRVILYNDENKQWIRTMANKYKSKRFFSLFIIELTKIPSLSIQVIDSNKVIVINVLKKANVDKKHIYIDSENLNKIYHGLYNDIIEKSIPIVENGVFNNTNFDRYLK